MQKKPYNVFFGTLANPGRIEIINILRKGSKNVSQICSALGFHQTTVSHNLKKLKKCGFVTMKKNGWEHTYTLNEKTIDPLMKIIDKHITLYCEKCWNE